MLLSATRIIEGMHSFTMRNLVILALVQIGVVTARVLAAGVSVKWMTTFNLVGPRRELEFVCDFGWIALALPTAWAAVALWEFRRETEDDSRKLVVVLAGWLLLALLIYASWHWSLCSWLRLCSGWSD